MGSYGTSPLTVGVILFVFLLGILLLLMFLNSNSKHPKKKRSYLKVLEIKNTSPSSLSIRYGENSEEIQPGKILRISFSSEIPLQFIQKSLKTILDASEDKLDTVYITESGIVTNINAKEGMFSNMSDRAVKLVEDGKYEKGFIGPGSSIPIIIGPALWKVVDPERNDVLGTIKTTLGTKELIYDGKNLIEIK